MDFRFEGSVELYDKIEQLKGLLAHKNPNHKMGDLFEMLCDLGIKEFMPKKKFAAPRAALPQNKPAPAIAVSQSVRREVWHASSGKCEKCQSQHALEIDHRRPKGKGGPNTRENLRLLCRNCNQREAIKEYGVAKMENFLGKIRLEN